MEMFAPTGIWVTLWIVASATWMLCAKDSHFALKELILSTSPLA